MLPIRHTSLRSQLAFILSVDAHNCEDLDPDCLPPREGIATNLSKLIYDSINRNDESRLIYTFLPTLLLRLFGYVPGRGWLETCADMSSRDRNAILNLLLPNSSIHQFCKHHSKSVKHSIDVDNDMLFEFSINNLPQFTRNALTNLHHQHFQHSPSYLAPLLKYAIQKQNNQILYLRAIDYFYICMIASIAIKWSNPSKHPIKRSRRSSSMPSMRALYNQLIGTYVSTLETNQSNQQHSIFIATCLDYLFIPSTFENDLQTTNSSLSNLNTTLSKSSFTSIAIVDAIASILLSLPPQKPDMINTIDQFQQISSLPSLSQISNIQLIYHFIPNMLHRSLLQYDVNSSPAIMCALLRVLALYLCPWRTDIYKLVRQFLYPKEKTTSKTRMAKLQSTISSTYEKLASPTTSPLNTTSTKEIDWRRSLLKRQQQIDQELIRLAIIKATQMRMATTEEGNNHLALLAEAGHAARIGDIVQYEYEHMEELKRCLKGIRDQKTQLELTTTKKSKNYFSILSSCVGQKVDVGMLHNISERMGIVSTHSNRVTNTSGYQTPRQYRLKSMNQGVKKDIPVFGSVWERPVKESEIEWIVVGMYRMALMIEPYIGFVPNFRLLGHKAFWAIMLMVYLINVGVKLVRNTKVHLLHYFWIWFGLMVLVVVALIVKWIGKEIKQL